MGPWLILHSLHVLLYYALNFSLFGYFRSISFSKLSLANIRRTSHTLSIPSTPDVTTLFPSGLNATFDLPVRWAFVLKTASHSLYSSNFYFLFFSAKILSNSSYSAIARSVCMRCSLFPINSVTPWVIASEPVTTDTFLWTAYIPRILDKHLRFAYACDIDEHFVLWIITR